MRWLPDTASVWAGQMDIFNAYMVAWITFFTGLIFVGVFIFAVKFRRRPGNLVPVQVAGSVPLEVVWTVIPAIISLSMFVWAANLYFDFASPPADAQEIYVTGRQWMWFTQHPNGVREINELHVPIGRPVRLVMSSEDVIHSFFIPAFRLKHDVLPGRFTSIWFIPSTPGKYQLFCAEFCGTEHSKMIGWVYVMEPADFENWIGGGGSESMSAQGEKLFARLGCASCHRQDEPGRCPLLRNVYGSRVELQGGGSVTADETYIRESILNPSAKVVNGYQNIMPSYQGQIAEAQLLQLMAYIRSIGPPPGMPGAAPGLTNQQKKEQKR